MVDMCMLNVDMAPIALWLELNKNILWKKLEDLLKQVTTSVII